jgi:hypothetical protein
VAANSLTLKRSRLSGSNHTGILDSACCCSAIPIELYLDHGVGHRPAQAGPEFSIACSGQVRVAPIGPERSFLPSSASVRRSSGLCSWILDPQIRRTSAHPNRPLASGASSRRLFRYTPFRTNQLSLLHALHITRLLPWLTSSATDLPVVDIDDIQQLWYDLGPMTKTGSETDLCTAQSGAAHVVMACSHG